LSVMVYLRKLVGSDVKGPAREGDGNRLWVSIPVEGNSWNMGWLKIEIKKFPWAWTWNIVNNSRT
jgi:hypothetical protein